ncbi:MAG: transporter related [Sedimentibacter sp.]|jgi:ABC-2 type transport system ATP-binding protein|nr:transporter related [Sedimentibacter sp.]
MQDYINVKNLSKSYGKKDVLHDISFSVQRGEAFGLLGVNGAGKTTTIECIEGLRKPNKGEITICGIDVFKNLQSVQKVLGVQLQSTALTEMMTAKEAMQLFCSWHKVPYRNDLLERFDMAGEYLNKAYASLSTGRKRRLHLALALCHNPKVLILDEPTAGLDVEGRHALHKELRKLKTDGVSLLIATHDMAEAEVLCDTIAIIKDGRIVRKGNPMELTASASIQSKVIIKTRESCLKTNPLKNIDQPDFLEDEYLSFACVDVAELLLTILTHIKASGDTVVDLRVERASIEDIFLSIAGGEN